MSKVGQALSTFRAADQIAFAKSSVTRNPRLDAKSGWLAKEVFAADKRSGRGQLVELVFVVHRECDLICHARILACPRGANPRLKLGGTGFRYQLFGHNNLLCSEHRHTRIAASPSRGFVSVVTSSVRLMSDRTTRALFVQPPLGKA